MLALVPLEGCAVSAQPSPSLWGTSMMAVALLLAFGARHALAVVRVQIGEAEGAPGDDVVIGVVLTADAGESVAAVENEIDYDPVHTPVAIGARGRPDCTVNAAINKEATLFGFGPFGCDPAQGECTAVLVTVVSIVNLLPIPSGSQLYTCRWHISPDAPAGTYPLLNTNLLYARPDGLDLSAIGIDGLITVEVVGDGNCDGKLTEADVGVTVGALFNDATACDPDCNRDGGVTAADIACMAAQLGSSH
jgi:hypothetical protein